LKGSNNKGKYESISLAWERRYSLRNGSGPEDRTAARCDRKGNKLRDLWLRFASLRAILASKDSTPWVWGRVAGDALGIGTLAYGYKRDPDDVPGITTALVAVAGATAADVYCAAKLSGESKVPLPPLKGYSDRSGFPNGRPQAETVVVSEAMIVSV